MNCLECEYKDECMEQLRFKFDTFCGVERNSSTIKEFPKEMFETQMKEILAYEKSKKKQQYNILNKIKK